MKEFHNKDDTSPSERCQENSHEAIMTTQRTVRILTSSEDEDVEEKRMTSVRFNRKIRRNPRSTVHHNNDSESSSSISKSCNLQELRRKKTKILSCQESRRERPNSDSSVTSHSSLKSLMEKIDRLKENMQKKRDFDPILGALMKNTSKLHRKSASEKDGKISSEDAVKSIKIEGDRKYRTFKTHDNTKMTQNSENTTNHTDTSIKRPFDDLIHSQSDTLKEVATVVPKQSQVKTKEDTEEIIAYKYQRNLDIDNQCWKGKEGEIQDGNKSNEKIKLLCDNPNSIGYELSCNTHRSREINKSPLILTPDGDDKSVAPIENIDEGNKEYSSKNFRDFNVEQSQTSKANRENNIHTFNFVKRTLDKLGFHRRPIPNELQKTSGNKTLTASRMPNKTPNLIQSFTGKCDENVALKTKYSSGKSVRRSRRNHSRSRSSGRFSASSISVHSRSSSRSSYRCKRRRRFTSSDSSTRYRSKSSRSDKGNNVKRLPVQDIVFYKFLLTSN